MAQRRSPILYPEARATLDRVFKETEARHLGGEASPPCPRSLDSAFDVLFASDTQAHREVLVGCAIARLQSREINIRHTYMKHGSDAFNGRTLDSKVVNPFLRENRIPCTTGPYLSAFRRGVKIVAETAVGVRDQTAFKALLTCVGYLESLRDDDSILAFIKYLLFRFVRLREESFVQVIRVGRMSLEQYAAVIEQLLRLRSGGRIPVMVAVAVLTTLNRCYSLGWEIEWQGINVADAASEAAGDVTVRKDGRIIIAAEITERTVDRNRVVATFRTKIVDVRPEEYIFFAKPSDDSQTLGQTNRYFAQGYDIDFADLFAWARGTLLTLGPAGRAGFGVAFVEILEAEGTPGSIKASWNTIVSEIMAPSTPPT